LSARLNGGATAGEADLAIFDRAGDKLVVEAKEDATLLVLNGQPLNEPGVSGVSVHAGDFLYTAPGNVHAVQSESGCVVLLSVPQEVVKFQ
jgi:redox-sensitive bicupin YhaK (pirin superfamily)